MIKGHWGALVAYSRTKLNCAHSSIPQYRFVLCNGKCLHGISIGANSWKARAIPTGNACALLKNSCYSQVLYRYLHLNIVGKGDWK